MDVQQVHTRSDPVRLLSLRLRTIQLGFLGFSDNLADGGLTRKPLSAFLPALFN
jgi:hypothetical protein